MDELVRWLGVQLDEDERIARAASGPNARYPHWALSEWQGREEPHSLIGQGTLDHPTVLGHFTSQPIFTTHAEHAVRHDPARVLREIDAKRQVLAAYSQGAPSDVIDVKYARGYVDALGKAVRLLALPYADRPGYKESWRP
ncbi:DUF6221 family protein [Streptomyces malaysiensis]|uniref:DUF6221 family protein n=1 Tax=Streptomyces malaysiensis TaxID=92644 RepID=UPI0011CD88A6|nr:DUF6221 family protein [Streptomyces malaysiensis]